MKKVLKGLLIVAAIALIAIQFHRPAKTNPPTDPTRTLQAVMDPPPQVNAILKRACNDCHSHGTVWPWYSHIAPVSWLVVNDVNEGREHLNFSNWAAYPPNDAAHALEEMCEETKKGTMPLPNYVRAHPEARLSQADVRTLCEWAEQFDDEGGRGRGRNRGRGSR